MKKIALLALFLALACGPASASEETRPDDRVVFDLSAENWVTTKTARVVLNVEASATGNASGAMRAAMAKAVGDVVKADWRLIGFSRSQDQTGMERWSAQYEARLPEADLNALNDNAKKISKPGLQVTVSGIDFSPTLDERQATLGQTRTQLYKQANEQLAALNAALPGRTYRIALIDFTSNGSASSYELDGMRPMMALAKAAAPGASGRANAFELAQAPMEKAEKIVLTARVVLAVAPAAAKEEPAAKAK